MSRPKVTIKVTDDIPLRYVVECEDCHWRVTRECGDAASIARQEHLERYHPKTPATKPHEVRVVKEFLA